MFKKVAVMGAGSLGTILGAFLAKAGVDVTLIDSYAEHVNVLNEKGAHVIGKIDFIAPVKAVMSDQIKEKYDLIIYMAKQTYNDVAIPQMVGACHKDTIICCCQNGIPEYAVAKYWPESQICGAPVGWGATFIEPGVSEYTSQPAAANFHLGTLDGKDHPWLADVKAVLENMCQVIVSDNLPGDRWAKVLINSSYSGLSTVTGAKFGDVAYDPIGAICLTMIDKETVEVANAAGVDIVPFSGIDWKEFAKFSNEEEQQARIAELRKSIMKSYDIVASMLQDLRRGRKCEIAQIDGVVAETGDKYGIDTPFIDLVVKLVTEMEEGKRKWEFANLEEFKPLIEKYSFVKA